jgi:starch phosphorylase
MFAGDQDIARAILELEVFLPEPLRPLARVVYNYRWSWTSDGAAMFEAIDPERWVRCPPGGVLL